MRRKTEGRVCRALIFHQPINVKKIHSGECTSTELTAELIASVHRHIVREQAKVSEERGEELNFESEDLVRSQN